MAVAGLYCQSEDSFNSFCFTAATCVSNRRVKGAMSSQNNVLRLEEQGVTLNDDLINKIKIKMLWAAT